MIKINLTGDYALADPVNISDTTELVHLDAFLAALRGSVNAESETFLTAISTLINNVKRRDSSDVALQITSSLVDNNLTHEFRIVKP